jgi:hypothetical protein
MSTVISVMASIGLVYAIARFAISRLFPRETR